MMQISLAGWSLHRRFQNKEQPLSLLDYFAVAREEFGIDRVELNSPFFAYADADNSAASPIKARYLGELRRRAEDAGVRIVGIAVDGHGDLSDLDEPARRKAVEQHRKWYDACQELACPAFRANSGGTRTAEIRSEHVDQCARSFDQLAAWAAEAGLQVLMENHWGLSADPERIVRVVEAVDNPAFGVLADFRNFPPGVDVYAALERLAPYARFVHAKFLSFDDRGEDPDFDTARVMETFRQACYSGLFGIEYEGKGDDHEGVLRSRELLDRCAYTLPED